MQNSVVLEAKWQKKYLEETLFWQVGMVFNWHHMGVLKDLEHLKYSFGDGSVGRLSIC